MPGAGVHTLLWPQAPARLHAAREALQRHQRVLVTGAWGSGRSTLLNQLARTTGQDTPLVRVCPRPGDDRRPLSGLAQLLAALPPDAAKALPPAQRTLLEQAAHVAQVAHAQVAGERTPPPDLLAVRLAATALLTAATNDGPHLLLSVDDAQWLDETSAEVLRHTATALAPGRIRMAVAVRTASRPTAGHRVTGEHTPCVALEPLTLEETVLYLESQGIRTATAVALHRAGGGHPLLLQALAADTTQGPPTTTPRHRQAAATVKETARAWLATTDDEVHATLARVALAHEPTRLQIRRTWGPSSDTHITSAVQAGILDLLPGDRVAFTAQALRHEAADSTSPRLTAAAHRALATTAPDPVHAARHRLLGQDLPDENILTGADEAATLARAGGDCALAADILLAAAERTPGDRRATRLRRLTDAARDAAAAGRADLARHAADALATARAGPAEVLALLAAVDASGQELTEMDELLPRARRLAGTDTALLAAVDLRSAIRHNLGGRPEEARRAARRAVREASAAHQPDLTIAALTMQARMERITAHPAAQRTLHRALAAADRSHTALALRDTPRYLASRHALFDDRLDEAETALTSLLPLAEVSGSADDLQEVLRSLAELDVRKGACTRAARWSERALAIGRGAGLSLGPAWYTCALTAAAGSSFDDATRFARMGTLVSREAGDLVFTSRNLSAWGTTELVTGHPAQAAALLGQVAELEHLQQVRDVTMLRWQPDLVEALTLSGQHTPAEQALQSLRRSATPAALSTGWGAGLDRAEAVHLARTGHRPEAIGLLERAGSHFAELGLRLEAGRTQLTRARIERARRRGAAARRAADEATALFEETGARPWTDLAHAFRRAADGQNPSPRGPATLTATERKVVDVVVAGASNKEAAQQLFLSVKTVESVLSRVYRKLDVRSRNQLAAALRTP